MPSRTGTSPLGVFSFPFQTNKSLGLPTETSTPPPFNNGSSDSHNFTKIYELEIAANDITARATYVYSFVAAWGFIAGCFLLYSFIQTYRAQRRLAWLDRLLAAFCFLQLLLVLLSLHMVTKRPAYPETTVLGCAALYFTIDTTSLCSLLVLVLMAYVLTLDPPSHALLRKPGVSVALVALTSVLISLLVAGLRGPHTGLQDTSKCFKGRIPASYAAARLFLAFLIPYFLQFGLLISGCVRQWKSKGRFLSGSEEGPVFLTVTSLIFLCQLVYSVALARAAQLKNLSPHEYAILSVAEYVLFTGSAGSLLLVLFMHRPCRESLQGFFRQLRDCCQSPGRSQPNRNIIAPHIEITDTLQDIES